MARKRESASRKHSNTDNEKLNRIDKIKEGLYSRRFKEKNVIGGIPEEDFDVNEDWDSQESSKGDAQADMPRKNTQKSSKLRIFLIGSAIFFVGAIGVAAYSILGGNVFSSEQVDISISGPVSVSGGDEVRVTVQITNNNDTPIERAALVANYPLGAYQAQDVQQSLTRNSHNIGPIAAHETVKQTMRFVLFGEQNSEKELDFTLEFRFQDSNATLEKSASYTTTIASSPVDLSMEIVDEVATDQDITFSVTVSSNADEILEDIVLDLAYPFNFTFDRSDPEPAFDENTWHLGDLTPGEEETITISGTVGGQEQDEHVFKVRVGRQGSENARSIGTVYGSIEETVGTRAPFLDIGLVLDGDRSPEHIARSESPIRADIPWRNTLPTRVSDGRIEVVLSGEVLDKYSVQPSQGGFYQSADNTLVWNGTDTRSLSIFEPDEEGSVSFSFSSVPLYGKPGGGIYENPKITLTVRASGHRVSDTSASRRLETSLEKTVKFASDLELTQRTVYGTGPLQNTGPLPPEVETRTTYTIIWTVTNSSNEVRNTKVRTSLPTYVRWTGNTSGDGIRYQDVGGEVVWDIGAIQPGAGVTRPARQVAFQVALTPSVSQLGRKPILVGEATITGEDQFTDTTLRDTVGALTTELATDPTVNTGGYVVE